jgi:hypothetical protein
MSDPKNMSVVSLNPPDHEGFMTKCGGSYQSWKKRWFVLKGAQLYYFKTRKDKKATGVISISKESFVKEDSSKKSGKPCIAIGTTERVFFMYPDANQEQVDLIRVLTGVVERLKGSNSTITTSGNVNTVNTNTNVTTGNTNVTTTTTPVVNNNVTTPTTPVVNNGNGGNTTPLQIQTANTVSTTIVNNTVTVNSNGNVPTNNVSSTGNTTPSGGAVLSKSREIIPFMVEDANKVLEFWNIWFESIPKSGDINTNSLPNYSLVISCDGGELSWRSYGPQNIFIQKMVDFFWNVGAPESEIDRLNDFGALVNPVSIGSWINMSKIGGMDGGWFFPVSISLKIALEACDPDSPEISAGNGNEVVKAIQQWSELNKIEECIYVGRDMGAAPPRQTEIRIKLNQPTVADQLNVAISAFKHFRFPDIPPQILSILRQFSNPGIILSIISSSEGFVKIGVLFPQPNWNIALQLIEEGRKLGNSIASSVDLFTKLNNVFQCPVPDFIEFQYLSPGFGYNVYKEEFNVFIHFKSN